MGWDQPLLYMKSFEKPASHYHLLSLFHILQRYSTPTGREAGLEAPAAPLLSRVRQPQDTATLSSFALNATCEMHKMQKRPPYLNPEARRQETS